MLLQAQLAIDREEGSHDYTNRTTDLTTGTNAFPVLMELNYAEVHMLMSSDHFGAVDIDYATFIHDEKGLSNFRAEAQEAADRIFDILDAPLV